MRLNMADGIISTNSALCARILASFVDARLVIGTIRIRFTFWPWLNWFVSWQATLYIWWSDIARWAWANRLMIYGVTNCINSTGIQARIATFLIETASIERTIIVSYTLWICTNGSSIDDTAETVNVAWIWYAWIGWFVQNWSTFHKWISNRLARARAYWAMIDCLARRSITTHIWTWVNAFVVYTWFCSWTVWANDTLRMTSGTVWITEISRNTFAYSDIALISANRIHRTWRRIAWISWC